MNERRFIELLNLYVDDQLGPDEASELESAVMSDISRRRTYEQYCRLQRGCALLGDSARALAPSSQGFARSLREAERKIAAPRGRSPWRTSYPMFATAAMAACVAVVFVVNRSQQRSPIMGEGAFEIASTPNVAESRNTVAAALPASPRESLSVFEAPSTPSNMGGTGLLVVHNAREAEIAANDPEAFAWMQRIELLPSQPLVVDEQAFDSAPTLQPDHRVFRSRHGMRGKAEFAAFQFHR